MKRLALFIALCIVFCGFTICTSQEAFAVGTLEGLVTDAGTGDPIEGVTVEIMDVDIVIASATTDSSGLYSIPDVAAGTYDVTASILGYASQTAVGVLIADDATTTQDFALELNLLQGYVTDAGTGDPIEGATVEIMGTLGTDIEPATTDSSGFYSFTGIPADFYDVTASKSCYASQTVEDVEVIVGVTTPLDFALEEDVAAPDLQVSVSPQRLWPPNHKYRTVTATVEVSDDLDAAPTVTLLSVTSNEPDNARGNGDGNTRNDIVIVDDYTFKLRAERSAKGTGRIYTITYEAVDSCGNSTIETATVKVPKNNRKVR